MMRRNDSRQETIYNRACYCPMLCVFIITVKHDSCCECRVLKFMVLSNSEKYWGMDYNYC